MGDWDDMVWVLKILTIGLAVGSCAVGSVVTWLIMK